MVRRQHRLRAVPPPPAQHPPLLHPAREVGLHGVGMGEIWIRRQRDGGGGGDRGRGGLATRPFVNRLHNLGRQPLRRLELGDDALGHHPFSKHLLLFELLVGLSQIAGHWKAVRRDEHQARFADRVIVFVLSERFFVTGRTGTVVEPHQADEQIATLDLPQIEIDRRVVDRAVAFHADALVVVEAVDRPERRLAVVREVAPRGAQKHRLDRHPRPPNARL